MMILPISTINNQSRELAFKGLWGKERIVDNSSTTPYSDDVNVEYYSDYYPFLDESQRAIEKEVNKYEARSSYSTNNNTYANGQPDSVRYDYNANIMPNLPIKIADWARYVRNKMSLPSSQRSFIETTLKRANLAHYIK